VTTDGEHKVPFLTQHKTTNTPGISKEDKSMSIIITKKNKMMVFYTGGFETP
jgi:hypothetical protein